MTVYIPTMGRYANIARIVPLWLEQGMKVRLVVEPGAEYREYSRIILAHQWTGLVKAVPVSRRNNGIGYARGFCVHHAERDGLKSFIMSDDDMRPAPGSNMNELLAAAEDSDTIGVGAVRSIHDRFTGGAVSRNTGVILCPGGWGFQLFALNVANAIGLGNFDERLHSYGEDGELARQGIAAGIPWRVHCDVRCAPVGKRYDPGGINTRFLNRAKRTAAEIECLTIIHDRWPAYTNAPDRPLRVAWQKMLSDYIPGWKAKSAIHGGSL